MIFMDLRLVLDYSTKAQTLLYQFIGEHEDVLHRTYDTITPFNSIHKLMAHMNGAEERWVCGGIYGETFERYESIASPTLSGLEAKFRELRAKTTAAFDRDDLHETVAYPMVLLGRVCHITKEEMLFQTFNHEMGHRSQILMALMQFGIDTPFFDYPVLHPGTISAGSQ